MKNNTITTYVLVSKEDVEKRGVYACIKDTIYRIIDATDWFGYLRDNGTIANIEKYGSRLDRSRYDGWVSVYCVEWELSPKKHTYFFIKYGEKYAAHSKKRFA